MPLLRDWSFYVVEHNRIVASHSKADCQGEESIKRREYGDAYASNWTLFRPLFCQCLVSSLFAGCLLLLLLMLVCFLALNYEKVLRVKPFRIFRLGVRLRGSFPPQHLFISSSLLAPGNTDLTDRCWDWKTEQRGEDTWDQTPKGTIWNGLTRTLVGCKNPDTQVDSGLY